MITFKPVSFWKSSAAAEVTLDDFSGTTQASLADPWTGLTHTLGASANYIIVLVSWENAIVLADVTAGGISMTPVTIVSNSSNHVQLWWLDDSGSFPSSGSVSIVVDPDGGTVAGYVGVWSLIGAASGAPNRTDTLTASAGGGGSTSLATVPTGAFVAGGCNISTTTGTPDMSGEDVEDFNDNTADGGQVGIMGHNLPTSSSTITHTYTHDGRLSAIMAEILSA